MRSFKRFGAFLLISLLLWARLGSLATVSSPFSPDYADAKTDDADIVKLVNHFEQPTNDIVIQGNYAYVGRETRLNILDISNPISPTLVGQTASFSDTAEIVYIRDIAVVNDYAYVAAELGGLRIIDISDPTTPIEIAAYRNPLMGVELVQVTSAYTYITVDAGSTVEILDTSVLTAPTKVTSLDFFNINNITVTDDYLFVSEGWKGGWTSILDISDPLHPTHINTINSREYQSNVTVLGDYAYVSLSGAYLNFTLGGVRVFDIVSPTNLIEVGFYNQSWLTYKMMVVDNYAYLLDEYGLRLLDLTNPINPIEVSFYNQKWSSYVDYYDLAVAGDYIYVAARGEGLFIFRHSEIAPLMDVTITGPVSGATDVSYQFTAHIDPSTASLPITYTWAPTPDFGQGTSVVTYTWYGGWLWGTDEDVREAMLSVMATNAKGIAIGTHTLSICIDGCFKQSLPLIVKQAPNTIRLPQP